MQKHKTTVKLPSGFSVCGELWGDEHAPMDPMLARDVARLVAEYQETRKEMQQIDAQAAALDKNERETVEKISGGAAAFRDADALLIEDERRYSEESNTAREAHGERASAKRRWDEYDAAMQNPTTHNPAMKVFPHKPDCPRPESIEVPDVAPVDADILRETLANADAIADAAPRLAAIDKERRSMTARRGELAERAAEIAGQMREAYREYKRAKDWDAQSASMEAEDAAAIKEARKRSDAARSKLSPSELAALGVIIPPQPAPAAWL